MRILITGCRNWTPSGLAASVLERLVARHGRDILIVHGDCRTGVDAAFDEAARNLHLDVEPHPADWDRLGRRAGPLRNEEMVDAGASLCLAVHRDIRSSKGTRGCAALAIRAGIPTYLISDESGNPRRLTVEDL